MVILVCVKNRVLSEGLKQIINHHFESAIVRNHYFDTKVENPDIVLFHSPAEIETLKNAYKRAKFVCLDLGLTKSEIAMLILCHYIHGIIAPGLNAEMFYKALSTVNSGEIWLDQSHLKTIVNEEHSLPAGGDIRGMSRQDKKIISLVVAGLRNKEIADQLCLSEPTIKAHLTRIYKSLKVSNRSALAALAANATKTLVSLLTPFVLILPLE